MAIFSRVQSGIDPTSIKTFYRPVCNFTNGFGINFVVNSFRETFKDPQNPKPFMVLGGSKIDQGVYSCTFNYSYAFLFSKFGDTSFVICIGVGELYKFRNFVQVMIRSMYNAKFTQDANRIFVMGTHEGTEIISKRQFKYVVNTVYSYSDQPSRGVDIYIDDILTCSITEWSLCELYDFLRSDLNNLAFSMIQMANMASYIGYVADYRQPQGKLEINTSSTEDVSGLRTGGLQVGGRKPKSSTTSLSDL